MAMRQFCRAAGTHAISYAGAAQRDQPVGTRLESTTRPDDGATGTVTGNLVIAQVLPWALTSSRISIPATSYPTPNSRITCTHDMAVSPTTAIRS